MIAVGEVIITIAVLVFAYFAKDPDVRAFVVNVVLPYWFVRGAVAVKDKAVTRAQPSEPADAEAES